MTGETQPIDGEKRKLLSRVRRMAGQIDAVERAVTAGDECADILMQLAAIRGGVNSLMAEILEDHIRLHITHPKRRGPVSTVIYPDLPIQQQQPQRPPSARHHRPKKLK